MTAMKPALDLFLDANIVLAITFCLWAGMQAVLSRVWLKHDYPAQLRLMKWALGLTLLSPAIAYLAVSAGQWLSPSTPITVSDIAVAAYLRGDIGLPAVEFEALLNSRDRIMGQFLKGEFAWLTAVAALLVLGGVAHMMRVLRAAFQVRAAVRGSFLWKRRGKVDIRLSDRISVPFAARGLRRRHIVLPSSLITRPADLRLILAHEFQHLRDGDVEWELAFECLRPLLYWNPAFGFWKRAFDRLREFSCDQKVVARTQVAPQVYVDCLLGFCERHVAKPLPGAMQVAFFRAGHGAARAALLGRLLALRDRPLTERLRGLAPLVCVLLTLGVAVAAASVRNPGDWSHDRLMLSTIVNLERMEMINGR